ncbi:MAG: sensory rhodopsin transducer [Clostridia bacterium]|nr:sensory rhodopsin transducer [Clostridia bacterium]
MSELNAIGKKLWLIPDCELPPEGEGVLKGHESVIVVNDTDSDAEIAVRLFFVDRDPVDGIKWTVGAGRVRCFRMNNVDDMCGFEVPKETQYAMKLSSSVPVVVQYGRLDNRQTNLAYYTTLGFAQ